MKTVFTNHELPHKWAHQTQPEGRNAKSSMSFRGASFFSYSTEVARIIHRNGKTAYIVSDGGYSSTTAKHLSMIRRTIPSDAVVFRAGMQGRGRDMADTDKIGTMLFDYAVEMSARSAANAEKARAEHNKTFHLSQQAKWLSDAAAISQFFGLRRRVDNDVVKRHASRIKAEEKRRAKEERERQVKLEQEKQEKIQQWLAGEPVQFPYAVQRVYIRKCLVVKNEPFQTFNGMETSRGATIPLADAERAFRFAIARREKGWRRNGEEFKVGDYQIDSVSAEGIVAGCHRLDWEIVENFAKQQGWI